MKRTLIAIAIILTVIITSTVVLAFSPKGNLKQSGGSAETTYELAMKDKKPLVLLFSSEWCSYCVKFMPKYKIIEDIYKDKYNFVVIDMNNSNSNDIVREYAIGTMPTLYIVDPKIDNRILISQTLYEDLEKLKAELDRYLRVRSMIPEDRFR